LFLKKPLRKRKDTQTIHVIGKIHDLMLGKLFVPKYSNLESPRVNIHIANKLITNDLIDLGATINALEMLELQGILRKPPIFIQMDNRSIVKPKGMLYGIIVSIDSWDYPIDFMVLQTKSRLGGYHLIMVRIWLENVDAYCLYWM
jgi:hypothetical protein